MVLEPYPDEEKKIYDASYNIEGDIVYTCPGFSDFNVGKIYDCPHGHCRMVISSIKSVNLVHDFAYWGFRKSRISMSTLQKDTPVNVLRHWFNYYIKLGIDQIVLYDNNSSIENFKNIFQAVLDYNKDYPEINIVLIKWPFLYTLKAQMTQQNHCLHLLKGVAQKILFNDTDEFLVPKNKSLFQLIDDWPHPVMCIRTIWFGCGPEKMYQEDPRKLIRRKRNPEPFTERTKCIIDPHYVNTLSVHVITSPPMKDIYFCSDAIIHHYVALHPNLRTDSQIGCNYVHDEIEDRSLLKIYPII